MIKKVDNTLPVNYEKVKGAEIIYKKEEKKKFRNEPKLIIKENNFISDEGINYKNKYQDNKNLTQTKNYIPKNENNDLLKNK